MYLIFGGQSYYSHGGANDLIGINKDKDKAISAAKQFIGKYAVTRLAKTEDLDWDNGEGHDIEWVQVYGVLELDFIYQSDSLPYGDSKIISIIEG